MKKLFAFVCELKGKRCPNCGSRNTIGGKNRIQRCLDCGCAFSPY